jgi:hypothetical protein
MVRPPADRFVLLEFETSHPSQPVQPLNVITLSKSIDYYWAVLYEIVTTPE